MTAKTIKNYNYANFNWLRQENLHNLGKRNTKEKPLGLSLKGIGGE